MLQPKALTFNRYIDLREWERDSVPIAGEVYFIRINDSDDYFVKIGDGVTPFYDLPCLPYSVFGHSCSNCEHLCPVNSNKVYAVCDETGKTFFLWQEDTRTANSCEHFRLKSLDC